MKATLTMFTLATFVFMLSSSSFARPMGPLRDQAIGSADQNAAQTEALQKGKKQKRERGPGKEIGKGGEDIGKGAGKGAESLGKGTAGAAANLVTLHPVGAADDLGTGAAGAGKDVGVGTAKGTEKIGKGSAKGLGRLGRKIVHRGKKKSDK
ncbi:MAG TPA: hypothetical protein VGZ29_03865 [Terriglobia bacterium]|nr:hypothetical protein [Terriglobia bacterium]